MDDVISRHAAIDAVHKEFDDCIVWDESGMTTANEVERILDSVPSAQPEIIRCKDCKFWKKYGYINGKPEFLPKCGFNQIYTSKDDFCSRAERKK